MTNMVENAIKTKPIIEIEIDNAQENTFDELELEDNKELDENNVNSNDNFYRYFSTEKILPKEVINQLFNDMHNEKNKAKKKIIKEQIVESHARLVMKYALKYSPYCKHLDKDDLFQAGMMGIMHAVDKYEVERGFSFSTYATWWIKQSILREISSYDKEIRLPAYLEDKRLKSLAAHKYLTNKLSKEPTVEEMLEYLQKKDPKALFTEKDIQTFLISETVSSLNAKIQNDENQDELGYFIRSNDNVEEDVLTSINTKKLCCLMKKILKEKEYDIIIRRYGESKETLQSLAEDYNVSRERIRQIEVRGLEKLQKALPKYGFSKASLYN